MPILQVFFFFFLKKKILINELLIKGNITLKSIPTPKPNGEEAAKMTKIVLPKNCGTCSKPVPHFVKKSMKGVRFHETPECYKCTTCRSVIIFFKESTLISF